MRRPSDSELSSELRDELKRSRSAGHEYDALAKLPQLRAALKASAAHVDGASGEAGSASEASPFTQAHTALSAWKGVLLAAIVGATVVLWRMQSGQTKSERSAIPDRQSESVVERPPTVDTQSPVAEARAEAAEVREKPFVDAEARPDLPRSTRSSRREIAQLVRIRQLLDRDPGAAYRLARQSEREFPSGLLSEERRALQVIALAKSGAWGAAEREAKAFFARYPQSPMRERVEAALRR